MGTGQRSGRGQAGGSWRAGRSQQRGPCRPGPLRGVRVSQRGPASGCRVCWRGRRSQAAGAGGAGSSRGGHCALLLLLWSLEATEQRRGDRGHVRLPHASPTSRRSAGETAASANAPAPTGNAGRARVGAPPPASSPGARLPRGGAFSLRCTLPLTVRPPASTGVLQDKRAELDKHGPHAGDCSRAVGRGPGPRPPAPRDAPAERGPYFDKVSRRAVRSALASQRRGGRSPWGPARAASCRVSASSSSSRLSAARGSLFSFSPDPVERARFFSRALE